MVRPFLSLVHLQEKGNGRQGSLRKFTAFLHLGGVFGRRWSDVRCNLLRKKGRLAFVNILYIQNLLSR